VRGTLDKCARMFVLEVGLLGLLDWVGRVFSLAVVVGDGDGKEGGLCGVEGVSERKGAGMRGSTGFLLQRVRKESLYPIAGTTRLCDDLINTPSV
jgi:hypothetical protein